jgi:hypothetical protein
VQQPSIASFTAAPSTINIGANSTLSWVVHGAASVSIDNGIGDVSTLTGKSVSPSATTTYTLTATNPAGSVTATATVTVIQKPVIATFVATPGIIYAGQSSTLSWSVSGATTVSLSNGIGDVSTLTS